ncbi:MAG: PilN domain-containing protein [Armatimonadota bacterium]
MPSVNMIAPRRAEKKKLERDMRRLLYVALVLIIAAIGVIGWYGTQMYTMKNHIADLDVQIAKLDPVVKTIKKYQAATKELTPKLELLNEAKYKTMRWYNTLDQLTQSLPESTFLTRIGNTSDSGKGEVTALTISGVSSSQTRVGETMLRLSTIEEFRSINLKYTKESGKGMNTAVEFEIGADLKAPKSSKGAEDKNGSCKS